MQTYGLFDSPSFVVDSDGTSDEDSYNLYKGMQKIPNVPMPSYRVKPNNLFKRSKNVTTGNALKKYLMKIKNPLVTSTPNSSFSSNFSLNLTPIKQKRNSLVTGHFVDYKQKQLTDAVKSRNHPIKDLLKKSKSGIKIVRNSHNKSEIFKENSLDDIEPLKDVTNNLTQGKITNKSESFEPNGLHCIEPLQEITNNLSQDNVTNTKSKLFEENGLDCIKPLNKIINNLTQGMSTNKLERETQTTDSLNNKTPQNLQSSEKPARKSDLLEMTKNSAKHNIKINNNKPNVRSKTVSSGRVLRSTSRLLSCTLDNTNAQNTLETQSKNDTSTVNKKKVEPPDGSMARKKPETNKTIDNSVFKRLITCSTSHVSILDSVIENNVSTNTINKSGSIYQRQNQSAKSKKKHVQVQDTVKADQNQTLQSFHDVTIIDVSQIPSVANETIKPTENKDVTLTKTRTRIKEKADEKLLNSNHTHEITEEFSAIENLSRAKPRVTRKRKSDEKLECSTNTFKEKHATIENNREVNEIGNENVTLIETRTTKKRKLDTLVASSNSPSKFNPTSEETVKMHEPKTKVTNKSKDNASENVPELTQLEEVDSNASENVPELTQLEEVDSCVTETAKRNPKSAKKGKAHEKVKVGRNKNSHYSESNEENSIAQTKVVSVPLQQYIVNRNYSEKSSRSSSRASSRGGPKLVVKTSNNNTTKAKNLEDAIKAQILPEVGEESHINLTMDSTGANSYTHTTASNVSELSKLDDDKLFVKPTGIPKKKPKPKSKSSILKQSSRPQIISQSDTVLHSSLAFDGIDSVDNAGICDKNQTSTSNDSTLVKKMSAEDGTAPAGLNKSGDHVDDVESVSANSRSQFKRITVHQDEIIPPTHRLDKNDIKQLRNSNFTDDRTNESANTDKETLSSKTVIQGVVDNKAVLLEWYSDEAYLEECKNVNVVYSLTNLRSHMCTAACGYIIFGPGQEKSQVPRKHIILFKVEKGRALVTQQFVTKVMEVNISFYIPLGSPYKIKNLSDTESLILYFMKMSEN